MADKTLPTFDDLIPSAGPTFDDLIPQAPAGERVYGRIPYQAAAGFLEDIAAMPGSTPKILGAVGHGVSQITGLSEAPPIINEPPAGASPFGSPPQNEAEGLARDIGGAVTGGLFSKGHWAENLVGGLGAGLGAHYGPQLGPYLGATPTEGAIGGAILGGLTGAHTVGNTANAVTRAAMPKPEEVIAASSDGYKALANANRQIILPPDAMQVIKQGGLQLLRTQGPAEESAKEVYSIFNGLDTDYGGTVADLINARKNLKEHFEGGPDANKPAAIIGMQVIDAMLNKVAAPDTLSKLKDLDTNWSAARTTQAVTGKVAQAESAAADVNSGLNSGNKILQSIGAFIRSRTDSIGKVHMNPSDLAALQSVKPSAGQAIERFLGIGGSGGLALAGLAGGLGAQSINQLGASATEKADPLIGGIGLPMLGLAARMGFNRSVMRAAKNAEASILGRAPYMQGVALPRNLLSAPQVAGRSLLFAAPAIRDEFAPSAQ